MKLVRAKEGYRKVGDKWLIAKKCGKCGRWLVASTVNFHKSKSGKYELWEDRNLLPLHRKLYKVDVRSNVTHRFSNRCKSSPVSKRILDVF